MVSKKNFEKLNYCLETTISSARTSFRPTIYESHWWNITAKAWIGFKFAFISLMGCLRRYLFCIFLLFLTNTYAQNNRCEDLFSSRILSAVKAFTDPKTHNSNQFRYWVHGIQTSNATGWSLSDVIKFITSGKSDQNPQFSFSIIDQRHSAAFGSVGFIIKVPEENIIATAPRDMGSNFSKGYKPNDPYFKTDGTIFNKSKRRFDFTGGFPNLLKKSTDTPSFAHACSIVLRLTRSS